MSEREEVAQEIEDTIGYEMSVDGLGAKQAAKDIVDRFIAPLREQLAKVTAERDRISADLQGVEFGSSNAQSSARIWEETARKWMAKSEAAEAKLATVTKERDNARAALDARYDSESALAAAQARIAELEAQLADLSRAADHDYWNQKDPTHDH